MLLREVKMKKLFMLTFMFLFLISCGVKTTAVRLKDTERRVPLSIYQVAVYETAADVPYSYKEIALIASRGSAVWTSKAKMLMKMREKAGEMGANAIILDAASEPALAVKAASVYLTLGVLGSRKGNAMAIFVQYPKK